ncbi:MAG: peptidase T [Sutterella sp.]
MLTLPATERFLQYVAFDTQSVRESTAAPSAEKELRLAEFLVDELKALGVGDAHIGFGGVVYGSIPATPGCEGNPAIGFIAHMDTSPDAPGDGIKPQILRFEGSDVVLNKEKQIVFRTEQFPEICKYFGEDVIFTDGTTLLGADDKAGIAEIMQMVAWVKAHPEVPHARLCIGFTPDEEVARGTVNFDIPAFGAAYAYTFDGGEVGKLESENFNGGTAMMTVRGVGVHPGLAKGKMVNSLRYAAKFIDRLPADQAPETTEGHEGFLHPNMTKGSVVETVVRVLIRDHDRGRYEEKKAFLAALTDELNTAYPEARFELEIKDSYENMKPYLDRAPKVLEIVRKAYVACGLTPDEEPIRGGTDGARLSVRGLPCPNVFTGGMNFHGVYECIPVKSLEKAAEVAVMLARMSAEIKSLR